MCSFPILPRLYDFQTHTVNQLLTGLQMRQTTLHASSLVVWEEHGYKKNQPSHF